MYMYCMCVCVCTGICVCVVCVSVCVVCGVCVSDILPLSLKPGGMWQQAQPVNSAMGQPMPQQDLFGNAQVGKGRTLQLK